MKLVTYDIRVFLPNATHFKNLTNPPPPPPSQYVIIKVRQTQAAIKSSPLIKLTFRDRFFFKMITESWASGEQESSQLNGCADVSAGNLDAVVGGWANLE